MTEIKKIRVVLADDEMQFRLLVRRVLESMNAEIVGEAKNGREAVELFKATAPHITFLDINMPFMDGMAALRAIKKINPKALVIMLTSLVAMDTVTACLEAGANNYIRKDTPLNEIKLIIKESWQEWVNDNRPGAETGTGHRALI